MRRAFAFVGSAVFLVIAPGTIAGYLPWRISRWHWQAPLLGFPAVRVLGALLIVAGLPVLLESFGRFAWKGLGTPAPVLPPQHLVSSGFYRWVRNPMYVAVTSMIVGQGLMFGSVAVLEYGALVWLIFHFFVLVYEEPTLRATFGAEFETFCANVPRWIPRLRPWIPS